MLGCKPSKHYSLNVYKIEGLSPFSANTMDSPKLTVC